MPYLLCRHIMPTGSHCNSPALKGKPLCYYHNRVKQLTGRPKRHASVRIPFQFPEDRLAVQMNFHLLAQAIVEGKLESRQANAVTHAYRAAAANLKAGPLVPARVKHPVARVILTPDEEEIAPAREACLPGEELTHGPECPCSYCAEKFRNAPGELHHLDCTCGLCHEEEADSEKENQHHAAETTQEEEPAAPAPANNHASPAVSVPEECHSERAQRSEKPAVNNNDLPDQAKRVETKSPREAAIAALYRAAEAQQAKIESQSKSAPAAITVPTLLATASDARPSSHAKTARRAAGDVFGVPPLANHQLDDEEAKEESTPAATYESALREYRERPAALQTPAAATKRVLPEGIRRYNELMTQVERNKQLAEETWQRFVAAEQAAGRTVADPLADRAVLVTNPDGTTTRRYLTWNEQEDRRLAHRRRLLDKELGPIRKEEDATNEFWV